MQITNINAENGIIYFHADSVPYNLENMNNGYVINKILKNQEGFELSDYELEHTDFVNECEQYLESYILELKSDWIEILESDTDNYLSEIDSDYFDSEFCKVYNIKSLNEFVFLFSINGNKIMISLHNKGVYILDEKGQNKSFNDLYLKSNNLTDFETANQIFQTMYRESESYLSVVAKEILIRSHQDFLYSKKQVVVI